MRYAPALLSSPAKHAQVVLNALLRLAAEVVRLPAPSGTGMLPGAHLGAYWLALRGLLRTDAHKEALLHTWLPEWLRLYGELGPAPVDAQADVRRLELVRLLTHCCRRADPDVASEALPPGVDGALRLVDGGRVSADSSTGTLLPAAAARPLLLAVLQHTPLLSPRSSLWPEGSAAYASRVSAPAHIPPGCSSTCPWLARPGGSLQLAWPATPLSCHSSSAPPSI
jgi:hypothetical protein